jgi:hypothetical protein
MRSKAEGSGLGAGALGGSVMATPSSDVIHNVGNGGSSISWSSADAKDYKFNRCEIVTSRVLLIVGNNHEQMGNANAQQYKADSLVSAPGGAKGYNKANYQRHSGKCQENVTGQVIAFRVGQKSKKDEDVGDRTGYKRYDITVYRHVLTPLSFASCRAGAAA